MTQEVVQRTPSQELVAQLRSSQFVEQVAAALPTRTQADRFVRAAVTAINQNPELVTVNDKATVFTSLLRCAQDGLLPDGREAAIVIYKSNQHGKQAQYLPMIGGYRKIAAQHGITLNAFVVYENDQFEYRLGENPGVTHVPPKLGEDRGEPIGAYAVATYEDGRMVCPPEVMDKAAIEQVRGVSRAKDSQYGPWVNWWDRMARKTVARLLFKQLPLGELDEREQRIAAAADDEADFGSQPMTAAEANVAATLTPRYADEDGPDDSIPGEVVAEAEEEHTGEGAVTGAAPAPPPEAGPEQTSFADRIPPSARRKAAG